MASRKVHKEKQRDLFESFHVDPNAWPHEPRIDKIVNDLINPQGRERVPGVAVAVRKDQRLVHLHCYGYANLETGAKITPDTIFDLGSLSKQFTAIAALDLLAKKKLNLDDHLSKFFKDFPRYADAITIEDLIHHTSALPAYHEIFGAARLADEDWYEQALAKPDDWYPGMRNRKRKELTNKDILGWIAAQKLLPREPDTEYEYSNSGYVVLAEVVAKLGKKRFADYLQQGLFRGLEMKDTYVFDEASRFSSKAREVVNHAKCYNRVGGRFVPVGYTPLNFITGDGNVHSTIKDLLRWELSLNVNDIMGLCFPDEAKKQAKELGYDGTSVRDLLWSPVELKQRKRVNYGAGWNLLSDEYEKGMRLQARYERGILMPPTYVTRYKSRAEYHRGEWLGWRSYFARGSRWPARGIVDPEKVESLGIIVLSNAVFGDKEFTTCRIAQEISRLYWGPLKKDNIMNNFNCA